MVGAGRAGRRPRDASFLPQPAGDLQPHAVGRRERLERRRRGRGCASDRRANARQAAHSSRWSSSSARRIGAERAVDELLNRIRDTACTACSFAVAAPRILTRSAASLEAAAAPCAPATSTCLPRCPSTSATSRCSSPSTSCSTNAARQPSGSSRQRALEIHLRHRLLGQPAAARIRQHAARRPARRSAGPSARPGSAGSRGTGSSPADTATCRAPTRRGSCRACGAPREKSPAADLRRPCGLPSIRHARLNSRPAWARYSSSNAARSPCGTARRAPCPPPGPAWRPARGRDALSA